MTQELRKLAEAADSAMTYDWEWIEFKQACAPEAILALLDRLEKAEKDAERYRWLRSVGSKIESVTVTVWGDNGNPHSGHKHPEPEELDNKIDAAMEASK